MLLHSLEIYRAYSAVLVTLWASPCNKNCNVYFLETDLRLSSQGFEIHLGATCRKLEHEASFFLHRLGNILDNQVHLYKDVR